MHPQARDFVAAHVGTPASVVEFGSIDVNGNLRDLFGDAAYIGVDRRAGPNVDYVGDAATYKTDTAPDLVVCCEVLEHADNAAEIVANAAGILDWGGRLIVTCATDQRAPHSNDGRPDVCGEWYRNIDRDELVGWCVDAGLTVDVVEVRDRQDLYLVAHK